MLYSIAAGFCFACLVLLVVVRSRHKAKIPAQRPTFPLTEVLGVMDRLADRSWFVRNDIQHGSDDVKRIGHLPLKDEPDYEEILHSKDVLVLLLINDNAALYHDRKSPREILRIHKVGYLVWEIEIMDGRIEAIKLREPFEPMHGPVKKMYSFELSRDEYVAIWQIIRRINDTPVAQTPPPSATLAAAC